VQGGLRVPAFVGWAQVEKIFVRVLNVEPKHIKNQLKNSNMWMYWSCLPTLHLGQ